MRGFLQKLLQGLPRAALTPPLPSVFKPAALPLSGAGELARFLDGYTIFPDAGSIFSARWRSERNQLEITDHAAHLHVFDDVDHQLAADFFDAADKDGWLQRDYHAAYRPVDLGRPVTDADVRVTADPAHMNSFLGGLTTLHFTSSFGPVAAKYRPDLQALGVVMKDGHVATYTGFPVVEAESLAASTSKGRWMHSHIKLGYNADRTWIHRYPYIPNLFVDDL